MPLYGTTYVTDILIAIDIPFIYRKTPSLASSLVSYS